MASRKHPILLRRGGLSGQVHALTSYRHVKGGGIKVVGDGRHDVTADFDALCLEELFGDAPDIIPILDGVAREEKLSESERAQVRAFHGRLRAMAERHNERLGATDGE